MIQLEMPSEQSRTEEVKMPNQVLFDTEILNPAKPRSELIFFQKPCGCDFCDGSASKSDGHTNMLQAGMLDSGRRHAVTGFGCYPEIGTDRYDLARIVNGAVLEFIFSGIKSCFSQPLLAFPNFIGDLSEDRFDLPDATTDEVARAIYPSRNGFVINAGAFFNVKIKWPKPPAVSRPIMIMVVIDGYSVESGIPDRYPLAIGVPLDRVPLTVDAGEGGSQDDDLDSFRTRVPQQIPERRRGPQAKPSKQEPPLPIID